MDDNYSTDQEINKFALGLQRESIDITGYSKNNLRYLLNVAKMCSKQSGVPAGVMVGIGGAAIGGTVTLGTLTIPSYAAGFLAGFIGGTVNCMIGRSAIKPALDSILSTQNLD